MSKTVALMLALAVVTAGVLAAGSSGARQTQRTIGLITRYGADGFFVPVESGARSAAAALGDHLTVTEAGSWGDGWAQISAIKSLVARHAAAIAFATDEPAALKQVLPSVVDRSKLMLFRAHARAYARASHRGARRSHTQPWSVLR